MNQVQCIGRLAREVELTAINGETKVLNNAIAIPNRFKGKEREADFIPIVAWQQTAELMHTYLKKGDEVGIVGRLQSRTYEDKQQVTHHVIEIIVHDVTFLRKKQGPAPSEEIPVTVLG